MVTCFPIVTGLVKNCNLDGFHIRKSRFFQFRQVRLYESLILGPNPLLPFSPNKSKTYYETWPKLFSYCSSSNRRFLQVVELMSTTGHKFVASSHSANDLGYKNFSLYRKNGEPNFNSVEWVSWKCIGHTSL